jgi:hypothetical protein
MMRTVRSFRVLVITFAAVAFLASALLVAQTPAPAAARQPMAEEVFKNIQVMKGVPADQFLASMGFISNATASNCTYCHLGQGGGAGWDEYQKDTPKKTMARRMITMVKGINETYFGGKQVVTCMSCHNQQNRPSASPNLSLYYSLPTTDEPVEITKQTVGSPSADEVLNKYVMAIGGAQRVAALTSFVAKGKELGYGDAEAVPLEIYAKAPNQRVEIVHTGSGDLTTTFDGRNGYMAVPSAYTPLPNRDLNGAELEGRRFDAMWGFPAQIKQSLTNWQGAFPTTIGDKDVSVIQGSLPGGFPVKLYFDDETGLLLRQIRYIEAGLGRATWQIDYSDYRDVSGVKMPFKWTLYWQSGKNEVELDTIQANVAVEASRFAKPAPAK